MRSLKPYYDRNGITIFHGDCREVLPSLDPVGVIVTDPVWPNAKVSLPGSDDPTGLFAEVAALWPRLASRVIVQLGCDTDPRFLLGVPAEYPFVRACWLRRTPPGYKWPILYSGDVAYVFGSNYKAQGGRRLLPGETAGGSSRVRPDAGNPHPCPRKESDVRWLVGNFSAPDEVVLDPFMGSGTTLVAAKSLGRQAIGVEIDEHFCAEAVRRLAQECFGFAGGQA